MRIEKHQLKAAIAELALGYTTKDVARRYGMKVGTLNYHRRKVFGRKFKRRVKRVGAKAPRAERADPELNEALKARPEIILGLGFTGMIVLVIGSLLFLAQ